jgi:signal peptidase I
MTTTDLSFREPLDQRARNDKPVGVVASPRRRLVGAAVLFLCFLLILRVWGAEPYEVPTGSMAPALAGHHRAVDCPRCGYHFLVGRHRLDKGDGHGRHFYDRARCPNCGCNQLGLADVPEARGDHLLVNKNVFFFRRPRRWEMIVFRLFGKTFVKRLIGLPGELVEIIDGDIYINHELARKTLEEFRAVRIPVFDNNYQPHPDGWVARWQAQPALDSKSFLKGTQLHLDAEQQLQAYQYVIYRHYSLDEQKAVRLRDEYGYNGGDPEPHDLVFDFMLECDLEVVQGEGWVALGINDGRDHLLVEIPVGPARSGEDVTRLRDATRSAGPEMAVNESLGPIYRRAPDFRLAAGRSYHVELTFVDQRVTLAIDGKQPFAPLDLTREGLHVEGVVRPVKIGARGIKALVSNIRLSRDIHYTQAGSNGVRGQAVQLGAGQYFVLGDNSPNSEDSRYWPNHGVVPEGCLVGKPFLVHLPDRFSRWQGFGRQWEFHGPDWERIRWIH